MKFYRNLYVSESIEDPGMIKWKLKHGVGQFSLYIIALAQNTDQLDIFNSALLKQKYFDRKNLFIVGLAKGYEEAVILVIRILEESVAKTGEADVKKYLLGNIKESL